jgi:dipeptidyl aminopeptidase/acylaminoacyl peptidase
VCGPASLIESLPPYAQPLIAFYHRRVGDPQADAERLDAASPLSWVNEIRIPLLIAHGANDPRVPADQARRIVAALAEHGIPHTFLLFEDEGHGLARPANRERFYAAAEAFLAEHLGGACEPAAAAPDQPAHAAR